MKGKTTCPRCRKEFVVDVPDDSDTTKINCPKCDHLFVIRRPNSSIECGWEEHGEPRKTILSSIRNKTNKPTIASFLLLAAGVLGIFTGVILASSNGTIISEFEVLKSWFPNDNNNIFSVFIFICSVFAFIGSFVSFKRQNGIFAMICACISILSFGLIIGMLFSIIALILLFLSRDEFENVSKGKIF